MHRGHQALSAWVHNRQILLDQLPFLILLMDEEKAVDMVFLDFSKAFDTISQSIFLEELTAHALDRYTLCWVKNLAGWQEPERGDEWT